MIDLGININTKDGIDKADGEIKTWIDKLKTELETNKIKIDFDVPKDISEYFKEIKKNTDDANAAVVVSPTLIKKSLLKYKNHGLS